jgi:hypothetical protein
MDWSVFFSGFVSGLAAFVIGLAVRALSNSGRGFREITRGRLKEIDLKLDGGFSCSGFGQYTDGLSSRVSALEAKLVPPLRRATDKTGGK